MQTTAAGAVIEEASDDFTPRLDMVTPGRFELPTSGLGNRCSIQLSYGATVATAGDRVSLLEGERESGGANQLVSGGSWVHHPHLDVHRQLRAFKTICITKLW